MDRNPTYEYAGIPLSSRSTKSLIIDLYAGKEHAIARDEMNRDIEERHLDLRGQPAVNDTDRYVRRALSGLPNAEYREYVNGCSYWKTNHLELGTGNKWIYCFYFERDQHRAIRDKKWCWKCNIGRTRNDPFDRIRDQTRDAPKYPIIPLLIQTDDELTLERYIHNTLKTKRRHLQNTDTNEDFLTCPSEVARIFFKSPHFSSERIPL